MEDERDDGVSQKRGMRGHQPREPLMIRLLDRLTGTAVVLIAAVAFTTALPSASVCAAPIREHVRGTVVRLSGDTLTVRTSSGDEVSVTLDAGTHYSEVLKSSLARVEPGYYIGTATAPIGDQQVALEVVVFPPSMRGVGEGHYAWDRVPNTTLDDPTTPTTMTNGTVRATSPEAASVSSTMTNGTIVSTNTANTASPTSAANR
jgi:hypothetical protein